MPEVPGQLLNLPNPRRTVHAFNQALNAKLAIKHTVPAGNDARDLSYISFGGNVLFGKPQCNESSSLL